MLTLIAIFPTGKDHSHTVLLKPRSRRRVLLTGDLSRSPVSLVPRWSFSSPAITPSLSPTSKVWLLVLAANAEIISALEPPCLP